MQQLRLKAQHVPPTGHCLGWSCTCLEHTARHQHRRRKDTDNLPVVASCCAAARHKNGNKGTGQQVCPGDPVRIEVRGITAASFLERKAK